MDEAYSEKINELVDTTHLTKREAQVYVLYRLAPDQDYATHEDVAAEIGIAPGNCRSKLSAAKEKARQAADQLVVVENTAALF